MSKYPSPGSTPNSSNRALSVFCGTGDHLWNSALEPVDSPMTLQALCEWLTETYQVGRLYWRGGQDAIWHRDFKRVPHDPEVNDWLRWQAHLYQENRLNEVAIATAKATGMEIFLYTGLFEHGVQPDVGIVLPHIFEDRLRQEHPEWCPLDRWQQRRCPGPICFGYPEARRRVVERLAEDVRSYGYDGITFYTYVENLGLRYEDEFGFNPPVAEEFNKKYPEIDLCRDQLSPEQRLHWYKCQGGFVTAFLSELHQKLSSEGKKLSLILDAAQPDFPQKWWGKSMRGTGNVYLDWEKWIEIGIVDEIWVQLGKREDQLSLLDRLLHKREKWPFQLAVRTAEPFADDWVPYRERGVVPVAVVTWERNGIERISPCLDGREDLRCLDWKLRAQALSDIGKGLASATLESLTPLARDPAVLVRHRLPRAIERVRGLGAPALLEKLLEDSESSVRVAAARALVYAKGPNTGQQVITALEKDGSFPFKLAAVSVLTALGEEGVSLLLDHVDHPQVAVQEACIRALGEIPGTWRDSTVYATLRAILFDVKSPSSARVWALRGLSKIVVRSESGSPAGLESHLDDLLSLIGSESEDTGIDLQLHAAQALRLIGDDLSESEKIRSLRVLSVAFRRFGDASVRADAAYGWRIIGNALLALGGREYLEAMRKQGDDKWLAWNAYETIYLFHDLPVDTDSASFNKVAELQAIEEHNLYAPEFPGWRVW